MISGSSHRLIALLAALVLIGPPAALAEEALSFERLMAMRRGVTSSSAAFTEVRTLGILDQPLESAGTLRYVAPDRLEKHTVAPHREQLMVDGDAVTVVQEDGRPRRFMLQDSPEMGALIESIRGTLSGDEAALERYYLVQVQGTAEAWQLLLVPRLAPVQALVDSIRIAGEGKTIRTVQTVEHGGDHTVMTITETGP